MQCGWITQHSPIIIHVWWINWCQKQKIKNSQKMKNRWNLGFTGNLIFNAMKWGNRWWISLQEWWFYISEGVYGQRRKWREIGRGLKIIDFLSKREKRKRWTVPRMSSNGLALCERKCCQKNITKFWNFRKMALFMWKHGMHVNMLTQNARDHKYDTLNEQKHYPMHRDQV